MGLLPGTVAVQIAGRGVFLLDGPERQLENILHVHSIGNVRSGLFATKSEAIRAALVKYGADLGLLRAKDLWTAMKASPKRRVSAAQLRKDVRKAEDAE